jgi:hypothetical protein
VGEGEHQESQERSRKGRGLNTPQWDSAWSDWLGSYGSCWLEVGAEGGFKLDFRQDHDPGKRKLKGAVRTETYWCHYCRVTHSLHGPFWPANHLNSVTTDSRALCILSDICAARGHSTVHNILLSHSGTRSLIMGASTSSLLSDSLLRCLSNLNTLGLTPDKNQKFDPLLHSNLAHLSFRQPKSLAPFRVFKS